MSTRTVNATIVDLGCGYAVRITMPGAGHFGRRAAMHSLAAQVYGYAESAPELAASIRLSDLVDELQVTTSRGGGGALVRAMLERACTALRFRLAAFAGGK